MELHLPRNRVAPETLRNPLLSPPPHPQPHLLTLETNHFLQATPELRVVAQVDFSRNLTP